MNAVESSKLVIETSVPVAVTATPQTVYTDRHAANSTQV